MSYKIEKAIPRPEVIIDHLPLSEELREQVEKDREEIIDILNGRDNRKILVIGPCSAWPSEAVTEYAKKLKEISDKVKDKIKIIMRVYTQKPRTTLGWTGPINQPDPFKPADLEAGIIYCRKMMLEILKIGLPIGDEALFTHNEGYFKNLLSWMAIGARSSEDQEHRVYASMIEIPIGVKNPTSGDLKIAVNSVISAQNPHVFIMQGNQVRTEGNLHAHLVLRGGNGKPNTDPGSLKKASQLLKEAGINQSMLVDISHDNSIDLATGKKDPLNQPKVLSQVVYAMKQDPELMDTIKGFMIESFLLTGKQDIKSASKAEDLNLSGLSITDGCIGIEETKELIELLYKELD